LQMSVTTNVSNAHATKFYIEDCNVCHDHVKLTLFSDWE